MVERDLDYYRRRLAEEDAREARCEIPEIRLVHSQLAVMYRERLERLEQHEPAGPE